jgi:hypothetical protein
MSARCYGHTEIAAAGMPSCLIGFRNLPEKSSCFSLCAVKNQAMFHTANLLFLSAMQKLPHIDAKTA